MNPPLRKPTESPLQARSFENELEPLLARVEAELAAMGDALRLRDSAAIETHAQLLHRSLEAAVHAFAGAARHGAIPPALRSRLAQAGGQVAAQRESLARATVALDRAIDVLMPRDAPALYGGRGWVGQARGSYQA